jgi:hypothetical protein
MRNDINDRRTDPFFTPGLIAALLVAVFLAAALFVWAPWSGIRVADTSAPGATTGQSSTAPRAPPAPAPPPGPTK